MGSRNKYALDYFSALAELAGGKVFPISNNVANSDPQQVVATIKASTRRSAQMADLATRMHELISGAIDELATKECWGMTWADVDTEIMNHLKSEGFEVTDVAGLHDAYAERSTVNIEYFKECMRNRKRAKMFMTNTDHEQPDPISWAFPQNTEGGSVSEVMQCPTTRQLALLRSNLELRRNPETHPECYDN